MFLCRVFKGGAMIYKVGGTKSEKKLLLSLLLFAEWGYKSIITVLHSVVNNVHCKLTGIIKIAIVGK
jgi:hypothetical protein